MARPQTSSHGCLVLWELKALVSTGLTNQKGFRVSDATGAVVGCVLRREHIVLYQEIPTGSKEKARGKPGPEALASNEGVLISQQPSENRVPGPLFSFQRQGLALRKCRFDA